MAFICNCEALFCSLEIFVCNLGHWSIIGRHYSATGGQTTHIYIYIVIKLGRNWFWLWFSACLVPSHYLNRCWCMVSWTIGNKFPLNLHQWQQFSWRKIDMKCHLQMATILFLPQWVDTGSDRKFHDTPGRPSWVMVIWPVTLHWHHNEHDGFSNHQPHSLLYSIVCSGADQRKHQSSASLAFVLGIHRGQWIPRTKGQ